jgi:hypothetical protein
MAGFLKSKAMITAAAIASRPMRSPYISHGFSAVGVALPISPMFTVPPAVLPVL